VDGASRGNPGEAGAGVVFSDAQGRVVGRAGQYLGRATNNVAEYQALLLGLEIAERRGLRELDIYADSNLLVQQLRGAYKVTKPHLQALHAEARARLARLARYTLQHTYRAGNAEADAMANAAIDRKLRGLDDLEWATPGAPLRPPSPESRRSRGAPGLTLEVDAGTAVVTLDRPQVLNAVTLDMWAALPGVVARLAADDAVRGVIFRGAGDEAFTSGADISEFLDDRPAEARSYNDVYEAAVEAVAACPMPTVAMIHGYCMGGGVGLAIACDLRFVAESARFAVPAARLSIVYPVGAMRRLVWLVGPSRAKDMLFSARTVFAEEARLIGLADRVVPAAELEPTTRAYLAELAALAPLTQRGAKAIVNALLDGTIDGGGAHEGTRARALVEESFDSADYVEGVRAFLEKRSPRFRGR
jgi:enoyl-CoA hydratase/carnithine racemase/ribonuclease HI